MKVITRGGKKSIHIRDRAESKSENPYYLALSTTVLGITPIFLSHALLCGYRMWDIVRRMAPPSPYFRVGRRCQDGSLRSMVEGLAQPQLLVSSMEDQLQHRRLVSRVEDRLQRRRLVSNMVDRLQRRRLVSNRVDQLRLRRLVSNRED